MKQDTSSIKKSLTDVVSSGAKHPYLTTIAIVGGGILGVVGLYELSKLFSGSGQPPSPSQQGTTSTPVSVMPQQNPSTSTSIPVSSAFKTSLSGYVSPTIKPSSALSSGYVGRNLNYNSYSSVYAPSTVNETSTTTNSTNVYAPNNSRYNQQTLTNVYAPNQSRNIQYHATSTGLFGNANANQYQAPATSGLFNITTGNSTSTKPKTSSIPSSMSSTSIQQKYPSKFPTIPFII